MRSACAASLALTGYLELSDYFINPSPPLVAVDSDQLMGLAFHELPDVAGSAGPTVDLGGSHALRGGSLHAATLTRLGFFDTFTNGTGWGSGHSGVVANPIRVREDAVAQALMGQYRPVGNRLGIGRKAEEIWSDHRVGKDWDPEAWVTYKRRYRDARLEIWDLLARSHKATLVSLYSGVDWMSLFPSEAWWTNNTDDSAGDRAGNKAGDVAGGKATADEFPVDMPSRVLGFVSSSVDPGLYLEVKADASLPADGRRDNMDGTPRQLYLRWLAYIGLFLDLGKLFKYRQNPGVTNKQTESVGELVKFVGSRCMQRATQLEGVDGDARTKRLAAIDNLAEKTRSAWCQINDRATKK
jgi:hypothetical protein